jgi:hypothetical protein
VYPNSCSPPKIWVENIVNTTIVFEITEEEVWTLKTPCYLLTFKIINIEYLKFKIKENLNPSQSWKVKCKISIISDRQEWKKQQDLSYAHIILYLSQKTKADGIPMDRE